MKTTEGIMNLLLARLRFAFCTVAIAASLATTAGSIAGQMCDLDFRAGTPDNTFDTIFTQDGPGLGLEPIGMAGWTGGDSTYSIELPNGDTAFFFSDSYIGEFP